MVTNTNLNTNTNSYNNEKDNLISTKKQLRSVSPNDQNSVIARSLSPIPNPLEKSHSPLRDKINFSKSRIRGPDSHRLTLAGDGINSLINTISEAYNSKQKALNYNNISKINGSNMNNYLSDVKSLPKLTNGKIKTKSVDMTHTINEKLNKFEPTKETKETSQMNGIYSHRSINSNSIPSKKDVSKEREHSPNLKLMVRDSSEKSFNGNNINITRKSFFGKTNKNTNNSNNHSNNHSNNVRNIVFGNTVNSEEKEYLAKKPLIGKYAFKSKAGMTFDGNIKTNQDSFLAKTKIFGLENYSVFGVFDGHGMHGHFVSNLIKLFFSDYYARTDLFLSKDKISSLNQGSRLSKSTQNLNHLLKEEIILEKLKEKSYFLIKNSFSLAESTLSQSKYETNFSGATSVLVLILDDKIICANAGDSRAILVVDSHEADDVKIIALSRDHKPELKEESARISKSGGRVERYTENGIKSGPFRVWLKNENFPGLAMSRSIGDFVAESVGVICEPGKNS
jgi:serine/threonine protein phosphatase PrpC